ncbi:MAG TPA: AsmA-like C-terminal region-containing protein [Candidatus Binataceae bacterium]|nr:AsmA-like C-terminal region-containing protein [Candidatus Binataceae bacterium]
MILILASVGTALWYAVEHQTQLVQLVLAQLGQHTGMQIGISGSRLGFGVRFVVVLEHPTVRIDQREAARLQDIRAVFSYGAIFRHTGLPLYSLVLERGTIALPSGTPGFDLASPDAVPNAIDAVARNLEKMSTIARRLELVDISLLDQDGRSLFDHLSASAYRHQNAARKPWIIAFNCEATQTPLAGARLSGDLNLDPRPVEGGQLASGHLWFDRISLNDFHAANLAASAHLSGDVTLTISSEAQISGVFDLNARDLELGGQAMTSTLRLGDYSSHSSFRVTQALAELSDFQVVHKSSTILQAGVSLTDPYQASRAIAFSVSGIDLELPHAANWLRSFRAVPGRLIDFAERFRSGNLVLARVALKTPQPLSGLDLAILRKNLDVSAALTRVGYIPPPLFKLPPVYRFDAQMTYSGGIAQLRQATGQIGNSTLDDASVTADLRNAPAKIPYQLKLSSWLDTEDLFNSCSGFINQVEPRLRGRVEWVHGHAPIELQATDTLRGLAPAVPQDYLLKVDLGDVQFALNQLPNPLSLSGGALTVKSGTLQVDHVVAVPLGQPGNVVLDGAMRFGTPYAHFHDFSADLHQIASALWLPLIMDPQQLAVSGPLGGKLIANSPPNSDQIPTVTGKLTLGTGTIALGFMRNPINIIHSATLTLDGKGLVLDLPASVLESAPMNFRMSMADFSQPQLRIDAQIARLDFEALRFIRLPWSPKTPPRFFPVPVVGHIEASSGNFDKLAMTDISTDFSHDNENWRAYNFRAKAFNGTLDLNISGRTRDDWININGDIAQMDAGPLFLLSGQSKQTPMIGKLSASANLWGNTDVDFFRTLAGDVSLTVTDGTLDRFTLLRRILGLVDLKNWLTAEVPDPRESGIPFKTLTADFRGKGGDFYTDNLRLDGPVIDITARGDLSFADNTMNMEIDLIPFRTANWIVNKIPIIGSHLAGGSKGWVGAYFHVYGPFSNPGIVPKPITTVTEFVIKTLTLPINIIAPNTIR